MHHSSISYTIHSKVAFPSLHCGKLNRQKQQQMLIESVREMRIQSKALSSKLQQKGYCSKDSWLNKNTQY